MKYNNDTQKRVTGPIFAATTSCGLPLTLATLREFSEHRAQVITHQVEINGNAQKIALGYSHYVPALGQHMPVQTEKLTQNTLNPVAPYGIAVFFRNGKTETPGIVFCLPHKEHEIARKVATACLITQNEIRPPLDSACSWQCIRTGKRFHDGKHDAYGKRLPLKAASAE